jgi:GT2 family glycosyltransferase
MIDVIIVNWNSGNHLKNCIETLKSSKISKIIVVDNASTDGSIEFLSDYSNVFLINSDINHGFAKGCNIGAELANSKFLLFLNPDASVYEDTLEKVHMFMEKPDNSKYGICGVQLIDQFGNVSKSCSRFPSLLGFAFQSLGLNRLFPKRGHFMHEWDHNETREVDQIIGAFFFVRKSVFDTLNGFDERFFVYGEEVDFSFRANKRNIKSIYFVGTKAFHYGCGTSQNIKARRLFFTLRSRIIYAFKNQGFINSVLILLLAITLEFFSRITLSLMRLSWSSLRNTFSAYCYLTLWFFKWILVRS